MPHWNKEISLAGKEFANSRCKLKISLPQALILSTTVNPQQSPYVQGRTNIICGYKNCLKGISSWLYTAELSTKQGEKCNPKLLYIKNRILKGSQFLNGLQR